MLAYVVLGLFLLGALAPFVYLISPAFRDEVELFSWPPQWFFGNFEFLFERTSLALGLNTFIFATGTTLIHSSSRRWPASRSRRCAFRGVRCSSSSSSPR